MALPDGFRSRRKPESRPHYDDDKCIMISRSHGQRHPRPATNRATNLLAVLSLLLRPTAAVLIDQWTNCLPESVTKSDPAQLQWVPLYVGAEFGNEDVAHKLRVTVWGNVTGSYDPSVALPAWNDPSWTDASVTAGKIVDNPFPTTAARLTTLHDKIDVLTYEPYSASFDFCQDALTNATCPLGPVFNTTDLYVFAHFSRSHSCGALLGALAQGGSAVDAWGGGDAQLSVLVTGKHLWGRAFSFLSRGARCLGADTFTCVM